MPKAKPKKAHSESHVEITVVGEVSEYRVLAAQLILLGLNPVVARRRVRALRLEEDEAREQELARKQELEGQTAAA